jgi:uncharacterized membrane protein YqiK
MGYKIITGKGVAVLPGFQTSRRLALDTRASDLEVTCVTRQVTLAQAEREERIAHAQAAATEIKLRAEREAEATRILGEAKADATRQQGLAEAEAIKARAAALAENTEAVIAQQLAENWPQIVEAGAKVFGNVDNMVVLNGRRDGGDARQGHDLGRYRAGPGPQPAGRSAAHCGQRPVRRDRAGELTMSR